MAEWARFLNAASDGFGVGMDRYSRYQYLNEQRRQRERAIELEEREDAEHAQDRAEVLHQRQRARVLEGREDDNWRQQQQDKAAQQGRTNRAYAAAENMARLMGGRTAAPGTTQAGAIPISAPSGAPSARNTPNAALPTGGAPPATGASNAGQAVPMPGAPSAPSGPPQSLSARLDAMQQQQAEYFAATGNMEALLNLPDRMKEFRHAKIMGNLNDAARLMVQDPYAAAQRLNLAYSLFDDGKSMGFGVQEGQLWGRVIDANGEWESEPGPITREEIVNLMRHIQDPMTLESSIRDAQAKRAEIEWRQAQAMLYRAQAGSLNRQALATTGARAGANPNAVNIDKDLNNYITWVGKNYPEVYRDIAGFLDGPEVNNGVAKVMNTGAILYQQLGPQMDSASRTPPMVAGAASNILLADIISSPTGVLALNADQQDQLKHLVESEVLPRITINPLPADGSDTGTFSLNYNGLGSGLVLSGIDFPYLYAIARDGGGSPELSEAAQGWFSRARDAVSMGINNLVTENITPAMGMSFGAPPGVAFP